MVSNLELVYYNDLYIYNLNDDRQQMSEVRINIPPNVSDNFGEPIYFFLNCVYILNYDDAPIVVDFSNCKFSNPFIIGGVVSLIEYHRQRGRKVSYVFNPNNDQFESYLKTIYFPDGFDYDNYQLDELNHKLESYHQKKYIPLVLFPTAKTDKENKIREKIISAVNSIFKNQLQLSNIILQAIYYLVDELTQNIVDHSNSDKGIIFAQFYPSKNYMDICIADYGKGLLQSYIDSGKYHPQTDEEAINFAVFGKSTKDLPESRGFGISTSRKMLVEGLKGKFFICSGGAFFNQNIEKEELISLPQDMHYKGCYIALRIPILDNKQFDFYKFIE
jgi:hypothetical protein